MSYRQLVARASVALALMSAPSPARAQQPASDLDAFMEKVLARRDVNRKMLNDYVLDETESFELLGPGRVPLYRTKREFTWYVRDKRHVRSPTRFDGVAVGANARDEYERDWVAREQEREKRHAKTQVTVTGAGVDVESAVLPKEPRFVSEAYFMDFKFEPGNYLLAGREQLEGHEVLRIEYYPTRLFSDDENEHDRNRKTKGEAKQEEAVERRMNKTALITLWVDPAEHQIVKYTFDNVWLDFLPGAWLVRVNDIRASMTMGQPFPGVWLPRDIHIHAGLTLANGSYDVSMSRVFRDYREAEVGVKVNVPKVPEVPRVPRVQAQFLPVRLVYSVARWAREREEPQTLIHEIRVHGNAFVTDAEVLAIAQVSVGTVIAPGDEEAIARRLKASGKFETVEVRRRFRSLTDPTDVALVLIVHERPGVRSTTDNPASGPLRSLRSHVMFLPIVDYADGYGLTYGARFSTVDLFGAEERLSVPLTWGGTKRASIEFDRTFDNGPVTRVTSSFGISNRENPRFDLDDQRVEFNAGAERQFAHLFRVGIDSSRGHVEFGDVSDPQWTLGTTAALDTRADPAFPANAVYLGGGWTGLHVRGLERIDRYTVDARGYLRLIGQTVLATRAQYFTSSATLPPYERLLLGGSPTLRGFRAGSFDGDRMLVTSAEVRTPLTSVISGARLGVVAFADAAKVANHNEALGQARWRTGAGAGLFLIASIVKVNLDVAHGVDGGGTRLHLATGFAF